MGKKYTGIPASETKVAHDITKRYILLRGPIISITALLIEQAAKKILKHEPVGPIRLVISSEGGDFYAAVRIFQYVQQLPVAVETVVLDKAFSGAFLISQAGATRSAFPKARFRFHQATVYLEKGNYNKRSLEDIVRVLDRINATQFVVLTTRAHPVKTIFELLEGEAEISAERALELNFIDRIVPKDAISNM